MKLVAHTVAFSAVSLIALGVAFTNVSADNARNPLADHVRAANERFKERLGRGGRGLRADPLRERRGPAGRWACQLRQCPSPRRDAALRRGIGA